MVITAQALLGVSTQRTFLLGFFASVAGVPAPLSRTFG